MIASSVRKRKIRTDDVSGWWRFGLRQRTQRNRRTASELFVLPPLVIYLFILSSHVSSTFFEIASPFDHVPYRAIMSILTAIHISDITFVMVFWSLLCYKCWPKSPCRRPAIVHSPNRRLPFDRQPFVPPLFLTSVEIGDWYPINHLVKWIENATHGIIDMFQITLKLSIR